jgi:hypothetical protein
MKRRGKWRIMRTWIQKQFSNARWYSNLPFLIFHVDIVNFLFFAALIFLILTRIFILPVLEQTPRVDTGTSTTDSSKGLSRSSGMDDRVPVILKAQWVGEENKAVGEESPIPAAGEP